MENITIYSNETFGGYNPNINDDGSENVELRYPLSFQAKVDNIYFYDFLFFDKEYYEYSIEDDLNGDILDAIEFPNHGLWGEPIDRSVDMSIMKISLKVKSSNFTLVLKKKHDALGYSQFWVNPTKAVAVVGVSDIPKEKYKIKAKKISTSMSIDEIINQHNNLVDDLHAINEMIK